MRISTRAIIPIASLFMKVALGAQAARGRVLSWARGTRIDLPPSFSAYIAKDGTLISGILGAISLPSPLKRSGMYEIRFSEYEGHKLVHVLGEKGNFHKNFEIKLEGEKILFGALEWWKADRKESNQHGKKINSWAENEGAAPADRWMTIGAAGQIYLGKIGADKILLSALGNRKRDGVVGFKGTGEEKRVLVYEADRKTLIREFYLKRSTGGEWAAIPIKPSRRQKVVRRGEMIRKWANKEGNPPPDRKVRINNEGAAYLCKIDKSVIWLRPLGKKGRNVLVRHRDVGEEKRVLAFEEDGKTLIREYRLEQTADGKWKAALLELTSLQEAMLHRETIRNWAKENGDVPPDRLGTISGSGQMYLCNIDGDNIRLSSLGRGERPGLQRFKDVGKEKRVLAFEEDGKTLIKEYRLEQTADGKWQAAPLELSPQQEALLHGERIRDWAKGKGEIPPDRLGTISGSGQMYLCNIDGDNIRLSSLGSSRRLGLQRFKDVGVEKRVLVFEEDGRTLIKEYRLEQTADGKWQAAPLELSFRQEGILYTEMIRNWAEENGKPPPDRRRMISRSGQMHLCYMGGKVYTCRLWAQLDGRGCSGLRM